MSLQGFLTVAVHLVFGHFWKYGESKAVRRCSFCGANERMVVAVDDKKTVRWMRLK